jgi:hypothetical protein
MEQMPSASSSSHSVRYWIEIMHLVRVQRYTSQRSADLAQVVRLLKEAGRYKMSLCTSGCRPPHRTVL